MPQDESYGSLLDDNCVLLEDAHIMPSSEVLFTLMTGIRQDLRSYYVTMCNVNQAWESKQEKADVECMSPSCDCGIHNTFRIKAFILGSRILELRRS